MKVLLVDDNQSTTKMMSKFLQSEPTNYRIGVANNGLQALDYYTSFKPDVVILDISMPGMDGIETLSRIFKIDKDANVIMATANDSQRTIEICLGKGALGYISKPYSPEELVTTIENMLHGGIYKRDLMTFFSRTANKIETSIHKMIDTNISVALKDVEVIPQYSLSQTNISVRTVYATTNVAKIEMPDDCIGFSTDVGGQLDGTIISMVKKDFFNSVINKKNTSDNIADNDSKLEFFNVLNTNILSNLADSMNVKLDALPIRNYIKDKDSMVKNKDLTKVKFSISTKEKIIELYVFLWLNMNHLFKHLF